MRSSTIPSSENIDRDDEARQYEALRPTIRKTVMGCVDTHGRKTPDAMRLYKAEADILYLKAYRRYNPSKGCSLKTFVKFTLRKGLLEMRREAARRHTLLPRVSEYFNGNPIDLTEQQDREEYAVARMLIDLSEDAVEVLRLVVDPPEGFKRPKKADGWTWRERMQGFLSDLGWASWRIKEAFQEVREAMQS